MLQSSENYVYAKSHCVYGESLLLEYLFLHYAGGIQAALGDRHRIYCVDERAAESSCVLLSIPCSDRLEMSDNEGCAKVYIIHAPCQVSHVCDTTNIHIFLVLGYN